MPHPVNETCLTLPGTLDSLDAIAKLVMTAGGEAGLAKKIIYRLRLAVDEVATNIVVHAYEENGLSGNIDAQAKIDKTRLTFILEDTGPAYTPQLDHAPTSIDLPIEEKPIGGLGVYLAARNVDKFTYERVGERNRHTFVVKRTSK